MPARLVNAPKAYVYTKDQSGATHNFSSYVVSGSVQRKLNQVSTAEITLRNPQKIFTTPSRGVAFHPMDPVTIYLERVQGFPVRVFTGYLDTTPYYQMFPGTITIKASCTLKRLLYTYFDPSLPYVIAFFTKYGWINTGQGSIISSKAFSGSTTQALVNQGQLPFNNLQDGSLAKLLWAILYDIGEWQDSNIYIENLPTGPNGIAERMAALMKSLDASEEQAADDFTTFLRNVIGAGSQGAGGGPGAVPSGPVRGGKKIVETLQPIANQYSVPLEMVLAVIYIESSLGTNFHTAGSKYYGWFQTNTQASPYAYGTWSHHTPSISESEDLRLSATAFCSAAAGYAANDPSLKNNIQQWAETTQGVTGTTGIGQGNSFYTTGWPTAIATANSLISQYALKTASGQASTTGSTTKQSGSTAPAKGKGSTTKPYFPLPKGTYSSNWSPDLGVDIAAPGGTPLLAIGDGTVTYVNLQGFSNGSQQNVPVLHLDTPIGGYNYVYYGHADMGSHLSDGARVSAGDQIGEVGNGIVGISTGPHLEIGFATDASGNPVGSQSAATMLSTLHSAQVGKAVTTGGSGSTAGSTGAVSGQSTAQSFVAELQFPSVEDQVTAIALGAEHKGLMHDQSLMPFVQQVCQASMRSFQSLPNGDFYAFYPDYFGEMGHHNPYWYIRDIEILDGGINLTDDALATHVFAVGDNCLALDTPVPTPEGWTTMGEIRVGDIVLGSDGKPTRVLKVSDVHHGRSCNRLTFEDGTSVVTDDGHLWEAKTHPHNGQRAIEGDPQRGVYSTEEMRDNLFTVYPSGCRRRNFAVKVAQPLELPEIPLPIDPYILGYWLGDGECNQMRITVDDRDLPHLLEQIEAAGYTYVTKYTKNTGSFATEDNYYWRVTIYNQRPILRHLDLLNNKHIPALYLRASYEQRLALLQGLMDSDGTVTQYCENNQTNHRLGQDLLELVCSLGIRGNATVKKERNGSRSQLHVNFAPVDHLNAFRLSRKAWAYTERIGNRSTNTSRYRGVTRIEQVESVPVKCITVDAADHLFLVTRSMIPTHNTWPVNEELLNMLFSAGTVNIFNAFVGTGIIDTSKPKTTQQGEGLAPGVMNADEAVKFIQRYGARPLVQNYPMVRSPIFEMLLAYQQFMLAWANQFKTPFTFTFMPELFPGGKVGFPDHGIQMYINSVTHSWNYEEGGFTTQAELSAPSLLQGVDAADFPDIPPHMVEALIEPLRSTPPGSAAQRTVTAVDNAANQILKGLGSLF